MHEFELIKKYFTRNQNRPDVIHGIGDDAAIVKPLEGQELAITTDTMLENIHFFSSCSAYDIGYKALAINLSDLAAVGATPAWITLALSLKEANEQWLQEFCNGLFALAKRYHMQLIGGDLTHGTLAITIQACGFVPPGKAILRSGARVEDLIYVTGTLGDAGLALNHLQKKIIIKESYQDNLLTRLNKPEPRITIGENLRHLAHAAIDISDGFAADLSHILIQSKVGAIIDVDQLPLSMGLLQNVSREKAIELALTAGDDYELCFTIPPDKKKNLETILAETSIPFTCVGKVTSKKGLDLRDSNNQPYQGATLGYQHF